MCDNRDCVLPLQDQGNWETAEALYRRALDGFVNGLGRGDCEEVTVCEVMLNYISIFN